VKVPPHFCSGERKFQGTKVPGNESSRERKYQGAKVPWVRGNESSRYHPNPTLNLTLALWCISAQWIFGIADFRNSGPVPGANFYKNLPQYFTLVKYELGEHAQTLIWQLPDQLLWSCVSEVIRPFHAYDVELQIWTKQTANSSPAALYWCELCNI